MRLWLDFRLPNTGSPSSAGDLARRAALLLGIVALHLLVILWLASSPPSKQVAPPPVMSVFTVPLLSGRGAAVQPIRKKIARPPATSVPILIMPDKMPMADASPSPTAASVSPGADTAAAGCALARDAGQAIGHDPAAMAELDALPPSIRSSTDAVMLWNGQWLDPGVMPAGIDPVALRRVVEQVAADAPAECRDAQAIGPQFIPVPEGNRTVMIVIGSGAWHWADLIASSSDCPPEDTATCITAGTSVTKD